MMSGFLGLIRISAQPVFSLMKRMFVQVFPPSVVLYKPRFLLSLQRGPGTATYTSLLFLGLMAMRLMCSEESKPTFTQFSPASVDLYKPVPMPTLFLIFDSPVPHQTTSGLFWSIAMAPTD